MKRIKWTKRRRNKTRKRGTEKEEEGVCVEGGGRGGGLEMDFKVDTMRDKLTIWGYQACTQPG